MTANELRVPSARQASPRAIPAPINVTIDLARAHIALGASRIGYASLITLFRMAGGMVDLATLGPQASQELVVQVVADGTTAILVILAMTFGLILPKMCIEHFYPGFAKLNPRS